MRLIPLLTSLSGLFGVALLGCAEPGSGSEFGSALDLGHAGPGSEARGLGRPENLDLVTWNVEWFGSRRGGPSDEGLQVYNAAQTLEQLDADLIALQEITSVGAFEDLLAQLPADYDGLLASDGFVEGNRSYRTDEQQVGFIWRTSRLELRDAEVVLRDLDWAFAGRPPLLARFAIDGRDDAERTIVNLHAKAASDADAWRRREVGARGLLGLLEGPLADESVALVGDFNDDLDESIRRSEPSPYRALEQAYRFATWRLAVDGISTTAGGRYAIDHMLLTGAWDADASAQARVIYPSVPAFSRTTSDHFPVVVALDWPDIPTPADPSEPAEPTARVVLNEVLANEPGSDPAGEFVELVNPGDVAVDVSGWTLSDGAALRHVFPSGAVVPPGAALVVTGGAASEGTLSLGNGGDVVVLADDAGAVVAALDYSGALASRDGVSMVRSVEGDPDADLVLHDTVSEDPSSPGVSASGGLW